MTVRATSANASSKAEFRARVVKQKSQPDPQPRYGDPVPVAVDNLPRSLRGHCEAEAFERHRRADH